MHESLDLAMMTPWAALLIAAFILWPGTIGCRRDERTDELPSMSSAAPLPGAFAVDNVAADALIAHINRLRREPAACGNEPRRSLQSLQDNLTLRRVASEKARRLAAGGPFAHDEGALAPTRIATTFGRENGPVVELLGRNLRSADAAIHGFFVSDAHCHAMMDARVSTVGVAVVMRNATMEEDSSYWVVELGVDSAVSDR